MPKNDAFVTPQLLLWARERIGMPVELAAKAAGVNEEKYRSWEVGEQLPHNKSGKEICTKS
jgi:DNA-binding transcriptional regulator YiaG